MINIKEGMSMYEQYNTIFLQNKRIRTRKEARAPIFGQ